MSRLLRRLMPPLIVSAFGVVGFLALVAALSAAPWIRFAETTVRSGERPNFSVNFEQTISDHVGSTLDSICPYGLASYRASVARIFGRFRASTGASPSEQAEDRALAKAAVGDALACQPMNSRLWLELARVEYDQPITIRRFLSLLDLSRRLAPVEAQLMIQRSSLMAALIGRPDFLADPRPVAEFRRAIDLLYPQDSIPLLRRIELSGRPEIAQVLLNTLPEDRRVRLAASLARVRSEHAEAQRPRPFEFTPFGPSEP